MEKQSLPRQYFDDVYAANEDPWDFRRSGYERDKYAATLAALPHERYQRAFEIGCSIGIFTAQLAPRCDYLLAVDATALALRQARQHLASHPNVELRLMRIPDEFPDETFDLIVLSEVGYYLSMSDLLRTRQWLIDHLEPGGHLVLVHWTPFVADYPLTGDQVHETFLEVTKHNPSVTHLRGERAEKYRLDVFGKR